MRIGGFQKVSLIDYPGEICSVVFCQGCNFRCPYCHNPELVNPELFAECLPEDSILSFLRNRIGKLDAVTVTGGEPTIQQGLSRFLMCLKELGYLVKIDTNGSLPDVLEHLIDEKLVDYIAMDIKGPLEKYGKTAGVQVIKEKIADSVRLILSSGLNHEFRTTVVDTLLTEEDLISIGGLIAKARRYAIQPFVPAKTLSPHFLSAKSHATDILEKIKGQLGETISSVVIRPSN
ncbi:MAG: Pyruvate formate-lyase 1-activating enzyme [Syntrophus sp. PtaU1.Bin208]|nr:MAG: Pyruvate formate-lyase 1-activating enzyme [Syntrophus sp. PtaU1.Bin208]